MAAHPRLVLALTAVYVVAIATADLVGPYEVHLHSALVAVPALVALTYRVRWTLAAGLFGILLTLALHYREEDGSAGATRSIGIVWAAVVVSVVGCVAARDRTARTAQLRQVRSVAEVAQRAVLRPVPEQVGDLRLHVRYQAAAAEARIGGDLYEVLDTPFGVRLLIGDVRGKGLEAVETAAVALGAFREAAFDARELPAVAERVETSLRRHLGAEDFVTAVLAEFPPQGGVRVATYGHEAPLLARGGAVAPLTLGGEPELPLGLRCFVAESALPSGAPETLPFGPGDQLLFFTDGAGEARDARGDFFPVAEHFARRQRRTQPDQVLDGLHEDLLRHVGGRLRDDTAMLLVAGAPARVARGSAVPAPLSVRCAPGDQPSGQPA